MMSRRRRVATALLLLTNATSTAAATSVNSHSSASSSSSSSNKQHNNNHHRQLQSTTYSNNKPITETQYQQCLSDILSADQNSDYELSPTEYIRFITFNSASNAYSYGYSAGQSTLNSMPLEFSMLFYTTACLCAYNTPSTTASDVMSTEDMVAEGTPFCCAVDNAHVNIYAGPKYASSSGITERQDIYMREFCTEAYHSYEAAAGITTDAPVGQPTTPPPPPPPPTLNPIVSSPVTTMKPTTLLPITTTPRPTYRPQTLRPTTSSPIPSTLPIKVTYGMSSDCGITAYDVMNPEGTGNTIKIGLETAMESVVVDILNSTWPRDDDDDGVGMGGIRSGEISSSSGGGGGGEEQQQQNSGGGGELLFQMNIIPNTTNDAIYGAGDSSTRCQDRKRFN